MIAFKKYFLKKKYDNKHAAVSKNNVLFAIDVELFKMSFKSHYEGLLCLVIWECIIQQSVINEWNVRRISWQRHQMEAFSELLALFARNSPVNGEFPSQRPVTWIFYIFFDLCLNKRLSWPSRGQ